MLHNARVEATHRPLESLAALIETAIADVFVARHDTAHSRNRQATFPALLDFLIERRDQRIDQDRFRNRIGIRITRAALKTEDDDLQTYPDLRRSKPRTAGSLHGIPQVGDQRAQFRTGKIINRHRLFQQARVTHAKNASDCH